MNWVKIWTDRQKNVVEVDQGKKLCRNELLIMVKGDLRKELRLPEKR